MTLRQRLGFVVGLVSLVVLAGAGLVMVSIVDSRMHDNVRTEALGALNDAVVDFQSGVSPDVISAPTPGQPDIKFVFDIVLPVGADPLDPTDATVIDDARLPGDQLTVLVDSIPQVDLGDTQVVLLEGDGGAVYVAVTSGAGDLGPYRIAAAAPLAETENTIRTLRAATIVAVPLLALVLGALAALVAGQALRPVTRMRAEADEISHGTIHRRLTPAVNSPELASLASTMNEMLDRLERSSLRQRQFASDASHELRSPLSTVRGNVELAIADPTSITDSGPMVLSEIDRLDGLVADLLTLSRLEERHVSLVDIDLDEITREQIETINNQIITVDTDLRPTRVRGDLPALTSMVRNLLDNALRHAATTVSVSVAPADSGAHLTIDDDGPGIDAADRTQIFDRFARLDDGRARDAGGTGLGLAVVAAAINAHNGTISVGTSPSGGARFDIFI